MKGRLIIILWFERCNFLLRFWSSFHEGRGNVFAVPWARQCEVGAQSIDVCFLSVTRSSHCLHSAPHTDSRRPSSTLRHTEWNSQSFPTYPTVQRMGRETWHSQSRIFTCFCVLIRFLLFSPSRMWYDIHKYEKFRVFEGWSFLWVVSVQCLK